MGKLSAAKVKVLLDSPGKHSDGDGLILFVREGRQASWVARFQHNGNRRDYAKRLKGAVAKLDPKDDIEATILRAAISPFEYADRIEQVEAVVAAIEALQTETQDGSGPRLEHARQIRLAGRFWGAFKSNGWPLERSTNSLMNQLLMVVLDATGEKRGTIKRLLSEAELNT